MATIKLDEDGNLDLVTLWWKDKEYIQIEDLLVLLKHYQAQDEDNPTLHFIIKAIVKMKNSPKNII
jgi:hypothetical protein